MVRTASKVISVAEAEVGYLEKATNANLDSKTANAGSNNYTKYARDLDAISGFYNGKKNGYAWCDIFVDWCFVQAFGVDAAKELLNQPDKSAGAGCTYSAKYYKNKGKLFSSPKPGDQIFFGTESEVKHTGLVYKVDSSRVYTIEGNTSGASGVVANGGGVCKKSYSLSDKNIYGYGRPAYDDELASNQKPEELKANAATTAIKEGCKVTLSSDAVYYNGKAIPAWVKAETWVVKSVAGDRVVIDKSANGKFSINSPVNAKYLNAVGTSSADASVEKLYPNEKAAYASSFATSKAGTYEVTANGGLYLRSGASKDKKAIELMKNGLHVRCYGYYTGDWLYVVSDSGKNGFCDSSYLKRV